MTLALALHPPGRAEPQHLGRDGDLDGTGGDEVVGEAGQQPLDRLFPAGEQGVEVVALRHAGAVDGMVGDAVALDDRHPLEVARQRRGGEQAGHAGAEHDGVVVVPWHATTMRHGGTPAHPADDLSGAHSAPILARIDV